MITKDLHGERIVEDERRSVVELVGGSTHSDTQGGERRPCVVHGDLVPTENALEPESAEVSQRDCHDDDADRKAYAAIAEGEVDCAVECAVIDEDEYDCAEGCREEGHKAGGHSHEQTCEPTEVPERDAEEVSGAEGSGGCGCDRGWLRHTIRIAVYG